MRRFVAVAALAIGLTLTAGGAFADEPPKVMGFKKASIAGMADVGDERIMLDKTKMTFPMKIVDRDVAKKWVKVELDGKKYWLREVDIDAQGIELQKVVKECLKGEGVKTADNQLGATQMGMDGSRCDAPKQN